MKATGIVRRIDDLGRVVIPKEIRRTMRIREGDPLEIYTDKDGEVIFKKYSMLSGLNEFARPFTKPSISPPLSPTETASLPWLGWCGGSGWKSPFPPLWKTSWSRGSSIGTRQVPPPSWSRRANLVFSSPWPPPSSHRAMCWAVFCWRTPKGVGSPARRNGLCWKPSPAS